MDTGDLRSAIDRARRGPADLLPASVRSRIEATTATDLSGVRIHEDPASWRLNGELGTAAFTAGHDVFFRRDAYQPATSEGQRLIAHEMGHVVGADVETSPSRIQAAVIDDERVRVEAERKYRETADELERKLGPHLTPMPQVHTIADDMLARLRQIVDAWAEATNTGRETAYGQEFVFGEGQKYYGSFVLTGKEIKRVFEKTNQPLRKKLNLIYYCVRNGNFVKYLEVAANELRRTAAKGKASTQKVKVSGATGTKAVSVKKGFAAKSGLAATWSANAAAPTGKTSKEEVEADLDKRLDESAESGAAPVFGRGRTGALGSGASSAALRGDKRYDAYTGLDLADTETLTRADVGDITTAEMRLLYQRQGERQPLWISHKDKVKFKRDTNTKILWEQGAETIEVAPASETRRIAQETLSRVEGGISGSTDLMMHAAKHLGYTDVNDLKRIRLALVAWMLSNRDHSFFEIMKVAADYGAPFHIDTTKKNWGIEYETADNFYPLPTSTVDDFKTLLAGKQMPSYYLSGTYTGQVKTALPNSGTSSSDFVDELETAGLTLGATWKADAKAGDLAEWLTLRTKVRALGLKASRSEAALKFNRIAVQHLVKDPAWHRVVLASVDPNARANLRALLVSEYGPFGVVTDADLTAIGVPPSLFERLEEYTRYDAYRLYTAVRAAAPSMKGAKSSSHERGVEGLRESLPYQGVSVWLGGATVELVLAAMLEKELGTTRTTADEQDFAASLPRYATYRHAYPKATDSVAHMVALGIPKSWLDWIDEEYSVEPVFVHFRIDELASKVATSGFAAAEPPTSTKNSKARTTLQGTAEHRALRDSLGSTHTPVFVAYLIEKQLGGRALTGAEHEVAFVGKVAEERVDELTAFGVPREVAEAASADAVMAVHRLRRAVLEAPFDKSKKATAKVNKDAWTALKSAAATTDLGAEPGFTTLAVAVAATMVRELVSPTVLGREGTMLAKATDQRMARADVERLGRTRQIDTTKLKTPEMKGEAAATTKTERSKRQQRYWATDDAAAAFKANVESKSPTFTAKLQALRTKLQTDATERDKVMLAVATRLAALQPDPKPTAADFKQTLFGRSTPTQQVDTALAYMDTTEKLNHLDAATKGAIDAIAALSPRERGALFQYTNEWHKQLGYATADFEMSDDFTSKDISNMTDKLRSLKFMLPMLQALHSALARLPAYASGSVYSGRKSGSNLTAMDDPTRLAWAAQHYRTGSVISYDYPLSTAKAVAASFIPNPGTDVALEIQQPVLSGKDVEYISGKPKEQEVLFPQGARFKVVRFQAQPPATAANTSTQNKLWVVLKEI